MTTMPAPPPSSSSSWTETAHEWYQRSRRKRAMDEIPRNPSAAAWSFVRPLAAATSSSSFSTDHNSGDAASANRTSAGTGIAFLDAALRRGQTPDQLPVVDVRGGSGGSSGGCGKTWTIITLAARFVVSTRPSLFDEGTTTPNGVEIDEDDIDNNIDDSVPPLPLSSLPQVIIMDSSMGITVGKLAYVVRSTLLRQANYDSSDTGRRKFQRDMASCLGRIHLATAREATDWIPILEALRCELAPIDRHPTLVLWDDFLSEPSDVGNRMEVIRQLARLLQDCTVLFLSTSSASYTRNNSHREWEKFVTHRIRLDREPSSADTDKDNDNNGGSFGHHEYLATVHGTRIPFSVSLTGILS